MRKLLWIGDAGCESGFAKCTHNTVEVLRQSWEVTVLGLNYRGDPDVRSKWPYDIWPCWPGGDLFGVGRTLELIDKTTPDLVVIQNDPWNVPAYMKEILKLKRPPPVVGAIAVDGLNCRGKALNKLARAIFWTEFAQSEAHKGGMTIPSGVVGLGVDLTTYTPGDKQAARNWVGLPEAVKRGFIVGNVNRNQPRKRLDLTIKYFAKWVLERQVTDAYLYLHVAPTGDSGFDCDQLAEFYGINTPTNRKLILAIPEMYHGTPEAAVARTMQAFDLGFSTTQGEGWGLTTLEMMACGIPQVAPDWAALGEWARPAAHLVPCTSTAHTPMANAVGGIMDEAQAIEILDAMYRDPMLRKSHIDKGLALAAEPRYNWTNVGEAFAAQLDLVVPRA
jgi:glycosyltransferase involved in cell wall biosynthesis